jgi:hypothetical protein
VAIPLNLPIFLNLAGNVISTFQVAGSMGFKGECRQWEHLLRIGE